MNGSYRRSYFPGMTPRQKKRQYAALPHLRGKQRDELKAFPRRRDGDNCGICHEPLGTDVSLDHIVEHAAGGSADPSNLRLTHQGCNSAPGGQYVNDLQTAW